MHMFCTHTHTKIMQWGSVGRKVTNLLSPQLAATCMLWRWAHIPHPHRTSIPGQGNVRQAFINILTCDTEDCHFRNTIGKWFLTSTKGRIPMFLTEKQLKSMRQLNNSKQSWWGCEELLHSPLHRRGLSNLPITAFHFPPGGVHHRDLKEHTS